MNQEILNKQNNKFTVKTVMQHIDTEIEKEQKEIKKMEDAISDRKIYIKQLEIFKEKFTNN